MRDKTIKILMFVLPLVVWIIWNVYWISENYNYSANDVVAHLQKERDVYSRIVSEFRYKGVLRGIALILQIPREELNWPHMTYLISSVIEILIGGGLHSVFYSNFFFSLIIIFSVVVAAQKIARFEGALYSLLILLTTPAFIGHTRLYGLDMPLTAFFILAVAILLLLVEKMTYGRLVILGIVMGIGVLVRPQFLLYISVPYFLTVLTVFRKNGFRPASGLLIPLFICAMAFVYWLTESSDKIQKAYGELLLHLGRDYLYKGVVFPYETGLIPLSPDWFLYYPGVFVVNFGIFNSIVVIVSLFFIIKAVFRKDSVSSLLLYLIITSLWLYVLFTVMSSKVPRYFFPVYPVASVIAGSVMALYMKRLPRMAAVFLVFLSLLFSVLMSHSEKTELCYRHFLHKYMKGREEVWLSVPGGREYLKEAVKTAGIIREYSSKKSYPSVYIHYFSHQKGNEFYTKTFYDNYSVLLRNKLIPYLTYHIEDKSLFNEMFFREKAMSPIYLPPLADSGAGCFTDLLIIISDKDESTAENLERNDGCPDKLLYKVRVSSARRDWPDISIRIFSLF